jgi:hypothetical protein
MLGDIDSILSLATDLQNILEDAMHMAKTMFPLKAGAPGKGQTPPHHLWPNAVLHDVHIIRDPSSPRDTVGRNAAPHVGNYI